MSTTSGASRAPVSAAKEWLTVAEVGEYMQVDPASVNKAMATGAVTMVATDPWTSDGTLVSRRSVDRWWRDRVLSSRTS